MADKKSDFDKWLMRSKDIIVIAAALTPVFVFGVRLYKVPDILEAQAATIESHEKRLDRLDTVTTYLSELVIEKRKHEGTIR